MSFLTGTQAELVFSGWAAGTPLTNTLTQTVISPRGNTTPLPFLPAGFFNASYGTNKALRFVARGVISTAAASQGTLTMGLYVAGSDTGSVGTSTGAVTGAFTPSASLANAIWEFETTLVCTGPGSTPNFVSMGQLSILPTAGNAATVGAGIGGTATTSNAGLSTESAWYLQLAATWGTASASNSITHYQTEVWGLN